MRLPDFTLERPRTLQDAHAAAVAAGAGAFDWLGGGTDLLCNYKWRIHVRPTVISLRHIPGLCNGGPGSLAGGRTLWEIEHDPVLRKDFPAIPETAATIATPLIRRMGTLAGNLLLDTRCWHFNQSPEWRAAHGSCLKAEAEICRVVPDPGNVCVATYSGDLAPVLMAYGASVVLEGPGSRREVPLSGFFAPDGIRRFQDKKPEEILVQVTLPADAREWTVHYQKLRLRQAFDFPEGGVAAAVLWEKGTVAGIRLATTGYATVPELHPDLGGECLGGRLEDEPVESVARALEERVQPMRNTAMSPSYRKKMARVLCRRALRACRKP